MGMDLHPSILRFFRQRMRDHGSVDAISRVDWDDEIIFEIKRGKYDDAIKVWLTDAYLFTETDFDNRPECITGGDYILVAKPEGGFDLDYEVIRQSRIGVGQIGKFMGALNLRDAWRFLTADEKEKLKISRL